MNIEDNIYYIEEESPTTTSTTTIARKVFKYEKPEGWDKKENRILKFFRILYGGVTGKDMDASDLRKFEYWRLNMVAAVASTFICSGMMYVIMTSPLGKEKYTQDSNKSTYIDLAIEAYNNYRHKPKEAPKTYKVVIVKDSLINIDSVAYILKQSDSILNTLRHADDSLTGH